MLETVHILNGDSTIHGLKKANIKGDRIIWREMLAEGGLDKNIGSDSFYKKRYQFFEKEYGLKRIDYYDTTIKELVKIEDLSKYDQVVLWFEYDLFCQLNLLGLCSYLLKSFRKDINYYLICTGYREGKDGLYTLADYSHTEYLKLFKEKVKLSRHDLVFADQCWSIICQQDPKMMGTFNFNGNKKFKYLQMAIDQHLKRFTKANSLNQIDLKFLRLMNEGVKLEKSLIRAMLIWQSKETVYGFGDLQYFNALKKLRPYYSIRNKEYYLNQKGIAALNLQNDNS